MLDPKEGNSMRNALHPVVLVALSLAACASPDTASSDPPMTKLSTDRGMAGSAAAPVEMPPKVAGFTAPELLDGYTRLKANTITGIEPGTDVTFCQYVMAPVDRDMDIVD